MLSLQNQSVDLQGYGLPDAPEEEQHDGLKRVQDPPEAPGEDLPQAAKQVLPALCLLHLVLRPAMHVPADVQTSFAIFQLPTHYRY